MKIFLIITVSFLLIACHTYKNRRPQPGSNMPSLNLLLVDSKQSYNTEEIPEGKKTVLIFFLTDCKHCQKEIELLLGRIDELSNAQIYFISYSPLNAIKEFKEHYNLGKYKNVVIGRDTAFSGIKYFDFRSVPYIAVYSMGKKFIKEFNDDNSISALLKLIE